MYIMVYMAIKTLSINGNSLNCENLAHTNTNNLFKTQQTIYYSGVQALTIVGTSVDPESPSSEYSQILLAFCDKNSKILSRLCSLVNNNNISTFSIRLANPYIDDRTSMEELGIRYNRTSETCLPYFTGTIPASDNGQTLCTTSWVRNLLKRNGVNLTS